MVTGFFSLVFDWMMKTRKPIKAFFAQRLMIETFGSAGAKPPGRAVGGGFSLVSGQILRA
jgi:hypothetical protein